MNAKPGLVDEPTNVREQLNEEQLLAYLKNQIPNLPELHSISQFPAGYSNLTYLLRFADRELVLRRPPIGARIKSAHDMRREYKILSHLYPAYKKVPRPLFFCDDESVLGAQFYIMERVTGIILRAYAPAGVSFSPELARSLCETFVQCLAEIHAFDYAKAGLQDLGSPAGYVARQIEGWSHRYYNSRTDDLPVIDKVISWLNNHSQGDSPQSALIHNDYKFDNLVLSQTDLSKVIAVLDWEMATIGDPLMDLGGTLGYWVETEDSDQWQRYGFGLTTLPGNFNRIELLEAYMSKSGREVADVVFYYVYGLFKIAVIVQQIYYRYKNGLTSDPRFASLIQMVQACGIQAQLAIDKKRIDRLT